MSAHKTIPSHYIGSSCLVWNSDFVQIDPIRIHSGCLLRVHGVSSRDDVHNAVISCPSIDARNDKVEVDGKINL